MNELLWHVEVPRVEGFVVGDVALRLGHRDDHVVPLLPVHLLGRDGPLEVVLLQNQRRRRNPVRHGGGGGGLLLRGTSEPVSLAVTTLAFQRHVQ